MIQEYYLSITRLHIYPSFTDSVYAKAYRRSFDCPLARGRRQAEKISSYTKLQLSVSVDTPAHYEVAWAACNTPQALLKQQYSVTGSQLNKLC